jgi:hypothetical protein
MGVVDPLLLVALAAACLGGGLAALSVGALRWLGGVGRWWFHWCGGPALRKLGDAPAGPVVIEGVLRAAEGAGPVVLATAVPPGHERALAWDEAVSAAAPELRVEMPDGVVLISGEALVASAACEIAPGQPPQAVRRALGELPAELCGLARRQVRCLFAGDRVLATGRIERAPDLDGPAGYRTRAVRHRLFPAESAPGVLLRSAGPPRPFVPRWRRWAAAVAGALVSASAATFALVQARPEIAEPLLREARERDQVDEKLGQGLYLEAGLLAERTNDAQRAARAYFLAGDLHRAALMFARARLLSPRLAPTWAELDSHLAEHRWELAAQVADLLAARETGSAVAAETRCFAQVLRYKEDARRPLPAPTAGGEGAPDHPASGKNGLCALALADASHGPVELQPYEDGLFLLSNRSAPPAPFDMDGRIALLLLRERGQVMKTWPFLPPHASHALRAQALMYRMPVFALELAAGAKIFDETVRERADHAAMLAVWRSFLGDHAGAAEALRDAFVTAGLEALAPPFDAKPGALFEANELRAVGRDIARPKERWMARLISLGAALALRAGELPAASAYVDLVSEEDDPTEVRRYVWAATGQGTLPMFHLEPLEDAAGRAFLLAAREERPWSLGPVLEGMDGQGLWPVVRPGASPGRLTDLASMTGGALEHEGDGLYALLASLAGRRAAAQARANGSEKPLAERIDRLERPLFDREASVLLYVSGRLAGP